MEGSLLDSQHQVKICVHCTYYGCSRRGIFPCMEYRKLLEFLEMPTWYQTCSQLSWHSCGFPLQCRGKIQKQRSLQQRWYIWFSLPNPWPESLFTCKTSCVPTDALSKWMDFNWHSFKQMKVFKRMFLSFRRSSCRKKSKTKKSIISLWLYLHFPRGGAVNFLCSSTEGGSKSLGSTFSVTSNLVYSLRHPGNMNLSIVLATFAVLILHISEGKSCPTWIH